MAQRPNKLLLTLSALGIAAGINAGEAQAQTVHYDSFGEFLSYAQASLFNDHMAKVDFVRTYPHSPVAQRMARQIARHMQAMPVAERRSFMDAVAARGGLPPTVAEASRLAGLSSAAIGRAGRQRSAEAAQAAEQASYM